MKLDSYWVLLGLAVGLSGCYSSTPAPADYKGSQYYGKDATYASDGMELPKYSDDNRASLSAKQEEHFALKTHEYGVAAETPNVTTNDLPPPSKIESAPITPTLAKDSVSSGDLDPIEPTKFVAPPPVKVENTPKNPSEDLPKAEPAVAAPTEPLDEEVTSGTTEASVEQETPKFLWPINGKVLSAFGEEIGGATNDGINIAAQKGAPIRATADGTVVYANEKLRDFGKMVIVSHANGWISAYAHLGEMVVKKGDNVVRGQLVAFVGKTGKIDKPQLHFSLRHNKRAEDPQPLLHEN